MNGRFLRNVDEAVAQQYDLIVVGGGIHGICLTLEAARRGHSVLLLERGDFGAETSSNSLRILHGGLRYLQSFDLERFRESVRARAWFLGHFPELTGTRRFLLPLDGKGLRRPFVFRSAFLLDRQFGRRLNGDAGPHRSLLGGGRLLSQSDLQRECPFLSGWVGAAAWHDGWLPSQQRLHIEMLRWAVSCGADVCNYASVEGPWVSSGNLKGVRVRSLSDDESAGDASIGDASTRDASAGDAPTDQEYQVSGRRVVMTTGPATSRLLSAWGLGEALPSLPTSRAYNVVIEGDIFGENGIALPARDGQNAFMWSANGVTHVGTVHEIERESLPSKGSATAATGGSTSSKDAAIECSGVPPVSQDSVDRFLQSVSRFVPSLQLDQRRRLGLTAGRLLSRSESDPEMPHRDVWVEVKQLEGLYASVGLKYTTAPEVARTTCDRVLGKRSLGSGKRPASRGPMSFAIFVEQLERAPASAALNLRQIAAEEGARHLDDLVLRRMDGAQDPEQVLPVARKLAQAVFGGKGTLAETEAERLKASFESRQPHIAVPEQLGAQTGTR